MRLAAFLLTNALLLAAWWLWLVRRCGERGSGAMVYAGLLFAVQLVLTETALGAVGWLRLPALLAALFLVTAIVGSLALLRPVTGAAARVQGESAWRDPANLALVLLALALGAWVGVATWLLPPRGVDDLAYHLPPLYQALQTGRLEILPVELRVQFAMPLGGDLLFFWPLAFLHADTWIDGVQFIVAGYLALIVHALARTFGAGARDALFCALLTLFVPVVMAQSGSNYNDLIVAASHLALAYAAVRAWQQVSPLHLAMAGLASGFALGVKYNGLVAIAAFQPLLLWGLLRDRDWGGMVRGYAVYVLAALPLPAFWLVRNALVTGNPLYPYELGIGGLKSSVGVPAAVAAEAAPAAGRALGQLMESPSQLLLFLFRDPGLGSANGGLGLVFWGMGLPALCWCAWRAWRSARERDWLPALFWLQVPVITLVFLQQTDVTRLVYNMRLVLVLAPLGLVALALLLGRLRPQWPGAVVALKALAVVASLLALPQLASTRFPGFDIAAAVADAHAGTATTPQRYYLQGHGDLPSLAAAFEPLDFITLDDPGWTVYMAADWSVFSVAPAFGSRVQNRIWNFLPEPRLPPDALIYHTGFSGGSDRLLYVRGQITPAEIASDPRYALLARSGPTELWVSAARLAQPHTRARLMELYRRRNGRDIEALRATVASLPAADVLIVSSAAAGALRFLELAGELAMPVRVVAPGGEAQEALRQGARTAITVPVPLRDVVTRPLASAQLDSGTATFHWNEVRQ